MKVLVTILILAALIGSLLYLAHRAIRKFDETVSQEESPEPEAVIAAEKLEKSGQGFEPEEQIKNERPRDPKTGRFIKKK